MSADTSGYCLGLFTAGLLVLALAGCGRRPEIAPVKGQITLDGKPVGPGRIYVMPDREKGNIGKAGWADFGTDGLYELKIDESDYGAGAIVGHHRVMIQQNFSAGSSPQDWMLPPPNSPKGGQHLAQKPKAVIPARYGQPSKSGLTAEVKSGPNVINFDLDL